MYRVSQKTATCLTDCNLAFNALKLPTDGSLYISLNNFKKFGLNNLKFSYQGDRLGMLIFKWV